MDSTYVFTFGYVNIAGNQTPFVRVKSETPVEIAVGYHTIVEEYPQMNVTHTFKVSEAFKEAEEGGFYYKWFALDQHSMSIDKSPAALAKAEQNAANLDYLCMMSGIDIPTEEGETTDE